MHSILKKPYLRDTDENPKQQEDWTPLPSEIWVRVCMHSNRSEHFMYENTQLWKSQCDNKNQNDKKNC